MLCVRLDFVLVEYVCVFCFGMDCVVLHGVLSCCVCVCVRLMWLCVDAVWFVCFV